MNRLFEGLVWSAAGFVGGFSLCWLVLKSAALNVVEGTVPSRVSRFEVFRAILGVLILVLLTISGIQYYRTTSCQTDYNQAVAAALQLRADYQIREGQAQIDLLSATLSGDRASARMETERYIQAIRDLERVRDEHPVPSPPDCRGFG